MSQLSTTNPGLTQRLDAALSGLAPGYFALVMATGIVSVAMHSNGLKWLSATLLVIAGVAYLCLVLW